MRTPPLFAKGERVRLTRRYAKVLMKSDERTTHTDWLSRQGTVDRCNATTVSVLWDGRRTIDHIPVKGVERIYNPDRLEA